MAVKEIFMLDHAADQADLRSPETAAKDYFVIPAQAGTQAVPR
jgi:hypothetical protein